MTCMTSLRSIVRSHYHKSWTFSERITFEIIPFWRVHLALLLLYWGQSSHCFQFSVFIGRQSSTVGTTLRSTVPSCMTLGKWFPLSGPQFLHVKDGTLLHLPHGVLVMTKCVKNTLKVPEYKKCSMCVSSWLLTLLTLSSLFPSQVGSSTLLKCLFKTSQSPRRPPTFYE